MREERFEAIRREFAREIGACGTESEVLDVKGRYTGKKRGVLQDLMAAIKEIPADQKAAYGQAVNGLKAELENGVEEALSRVRAAKRAPPKLDVTLPGIRPEPASRRSAP